MPANSRIIPDEIAGILLITDTAMNLKKLYTIISGSDIKPSAAFRKKKESEETTRPILMKMYAGAGANVQDFSNKAENEPKVEPKIEEVD
jgi:hypothetical protein